MLQCGVPVCGVLGGVGVPTARDGCGRLCGTGDVAEVVSGAVVVYYSRSAPRSKVQKVSWLCRLCSCCWSCANLTTNGLLPGIVKTSLGRLTIHLLSHSGQTVQSGSWLLRDQHRSAANAADPPADGTPPAAMRGSGVRTTAKRQAREHQAEAEALLLHQVEELSKQPFRRSPEGEARLLSLSISRGLALPLKRALPFPMGAFT